MEGILQLKKPLIIAHRGASDYAHENTLEAFQLAWEQGADGIEGDFILTSDKEVICFHDLDGERLLNKCVSTKSLSLKEIRALSQALKKPFHIPTLAEVLAIVPQNKKIFIEVKHGSKIVSHLRQIINESGLGDDQVSIISFRREVIRESKKLMPRIQASWIRNFRRSRSTGLLKPSMASVFEVLQEINSDGLSTNQRYVDKSFVQIINEAGYEHHCWTVNEVERAQEVTRTACVSITTNDPLSLVEQLR